MKRVAQQSRREGWLQKIDQINSLIDCGADRVYCKSGEIGTLCFLLTQTILSWRGENKKDDHLFEIDGYQVENLLSTLEMIKKCADDALEEGMSKILVAQNALNNDFEISSLPVQMERAGEMGYR